MLILHQIASSKDCRWISIIEFAKYFNKVNFDREHVSIKIKFDFQLHLLLVSETVETVFCFERRGASQVGCASVLQQRQALQHNLI